VLRNENRDWISGHKVNLLLQTGLQKNADLPDLPRMIDLAKNEEDRKVFEIFVASSVVGRSFVAPPGLPKERVEELRSAFMAMVKSPNSWPDVERIHFDIDVMSGAELQAFLRQRYLRPGPRSSAPRRSRSLAGH